MSEHVPAVSYQGISALRRLEQSPPEVEIVRKTQRPIPSTHNQKKTTQMSREKNRSYGTARIPQPRLQFLRGEAQA